MGPRHASAAASASVGSGKRLVQMALADPAFVLPEQAHLRQRLSAREGRSTGLVQKTGDCDEDYESWPEKTGLQALSGNVGDSPSVRPVLVDGRPGPHPAPKLRGSGCIFCLEQVASDPCRHGRSRRQHAKTRLADNRVGCLDDVSLRTLGLCAFVRGVNFIGGWPAVLATESEARLACAFARICTL